MSEEMLRNEMVNLGKSLFDRGYAAGGAGNMSLRIDKEQILATPSGSCLGRLNADSLSVVDMNGNTVSGDKPSKEVKFHLALYNKNPDCGSVVHLHSTWLTLLSCQEHNDVENIIKPMTPYYVMKIGTMKFIKYYPPGHQGIADDLFEYARDGNAFLLQNHGPVVIGKNLIEAVNNMEELEETAKLHFLSNNMDIRYLTEEEVTYLSS